MRLLQVANVASAVGGTGRCVIDCHAALANDVEHSSAVFRTGSRAAVAPELPGCEVVVDRDLARAVRSACDRVRPDVVLYHNVDPHHIVHERSTRSVLYVHSRRSSHARARRQVDRVLSVSAYLDRLCPFETRVLHQPVSVPNVPADRGPGLVVGRLATPNRSKWLPREILPLYERLAGDHRDVRFEFVGCPSNVAASLRRAIGDRVTFHSAGPSARRHLARWHVLLYHASLAETYGRTVCEAQQLGSVPLVSRRGGFEEQIVHGVDGFTVRTPQSFSACLGECSDGRWPRMSAAAIAAGERRGSLERWRAAFLEVLS